MSYMNYDHPDAFLDMVKKEPLTYAKYECPKCKGYGGWNLVLNEYKNAKNPHFCCTCRDCMGSGYVYTKQDCAHNWGMATTIGRCLTQYTCTKCGATSTIDSGD